MRHYGLSLVFFTPLILAMGYLANPGSLRGLILDRAAETTIGAAIGMLVLFAFIIGPAAAAAEAPLLNTEDPRPAIACGASTGVVRP